MKKVLLGILIISMLMLTACATKTLTEETPEKTYITFNTITINDIIDDIEATTYKGESAIIIADFIDTNNSANYTYQLIAADGYTPPFYYTYEELQNAYWLIDKGETFFPDNNIGKNRIRNLENITILVEE